MRKYASRVDQLPLRPCKYCGHSFRAKKSRTASGRREFCSRKCRDTFMASKSLRITRTCEKCGHPFTVYPSRLAKRTYAVSSARFCSYACAGNAPSRVAKTCIVCGSSYTKKACLAGKSNYCSAKCRAKGVGDKNRKHPINPRTRCGRGAWKKRRDQVKARDGYRCTRCGSTHQLVVHHIVAWRKTHDDSPGNLTTLCRKCHHEIEPAPGKNGHAKPVT